MPKKSARHSIARDAYFETGERNEDRCELALLWLRVVDQVWRDCHNLDNSDVYKARDARGSLIWIIENNEDFDAVCEMAGVNSSKFRSVTLKAVTQRYDSDFLSRVFAQHFNFGR